MAFVDYSSSVWVHNERRAHKAKQKYRNGTWTLSYTKVRMPWGGEVLRNTHQALGRELFPLHRTRERTRKGRTYIHECPHYFMRRRGAWFPETFPVTRRPNSQGRHKKHTHKSLNVFMTRRGAWFPKTFPVTRRPNAQGLKCGASSVGKAGGQGLNCGAYTMCVHARAIIVHMHK